MSNNKDRKDAQEIVFLNLVDGNNYNWSDIEQLGIEGSIAEDGPTCRCKVCATAWSTDMYMVYWVEPTRYIDVSISWKKQGEWWKCPSGCNKNTMLRGTE